MWKKYREKYVLDKRNKSHVHKFQNVLKSTSESLRESHGLNKSTVYSIQGAFVSNLCFLKKNMVSEVFI